MVTTQCRNKAENMELTLLALSGTIALATRPSKYHILNQLLDTNSSCTQCRVFWNEKNQGATMF